MKKVGCLALVGLGLFGFGCSSRKELVVFEISEGYSLRPGRGQNDEPSVTCDPGVHVGKRNHGDSGGHIQFTCYANPLHDNGYVFFQVAFTGPHACEGGIGVRPGTGYKFVYLQNVGPNDDSYPVGNACGYFISVVR